MPYSFTPTMKPFVISSLYESIKATRPSRRLPSTPYAIGNQVVNSGVRYICSQAGVTNSGSGPSGTAGIFADGTVRWLAVGSETVKDGDINSNLYVGIGKQTEWADPLNPPTPDTSYEGEQQALNDTTVFLQIDPSNIRLGILNVPWTSGTVYSQYDPSIDQSTYPTSNYCIVGGTNVYKCLDNNNGAQSVDAPSGTTTSRIETSDGYIWKYIGTIQFTDQFDFSTTAYVSMPTPVEVAPIQGAISTFNNLVNEGTSYDEDDDIQVVIVGDGSGATASTRTAVAGGNKSVTGLYATSGGANYTEAFALAYKAGSVGSGSTLEVELDGDAIDTINITAPGSNYVTATVLIIGDGTGAAASATITGGQISSISVTDVGEDYTWAKAYIVPGEHGSIAQAVFSPTNGHGFSPATELGVRSLLLSTKLTPSLNSYIPTEPAVADGSFRQVTLISGVQGTPDRNAEAYLGKAHPDYSSPGNLNKYRDGSGNVLYINNISAIEHTSSQEEVIKISISL